MKPIFDLSGKVAVITGGGSGIGKSMALLFARQGAQVIIIDLNEDHGLSVENEINSAGGKAKFLSCNIADHKAVIETFNSIVDAYHTVHILVNNAGISKIGKLEDTSPEDMDQVYAVNVKGAYSCSKAVIQKMKENEQGGVILNIASVLATLGVNDRFAYSATKGAILTMSYSIAKDYLKDNIRCNAISPARVHTSFVDQYLKDNYPGKEKEMYDQLSKTQPIGRMGTPDEIAHLALYLCSDEASFITGSNYYIDGGFSTLNN